MKRLLGWLVAGTLGVLLLQGQAVFAASRISMTPTSGSIAEGQSLTFTLQLDQPIIATPPGDHVTLHLTSSNPDTTSISPSTVTFAASEWAQSKTFIVTMPDNGYYGDTRNVIISANATSGSLYYNGFAAASTVHVTDTTPQPPVYPTYDHSADDPYSYPAPPHVDAPVPVSAPVVKQEVVETPKDRTVVLSARTEDGLTKTNYESAPEALYEGGLIGIFTNGSYPHRFTASFVLILATLAAVLLPLLYIRRRKWAKRQKARHMRWMERNAEKHSETSKKPVVRKHLKRHR